MRSPRRGFIAIAHEGDRISLIGALGGRISDDPKLVSECARIAEGAAVVLDPRLAEEEMDRLTAWLNARSALGDSSPGDHHSVRTALKRLAAALARCRPHARVSVAAKAAAARAVLGGRLGSHLEQKLDLVNRAKMTDADWLDAVCALRPDQRSGNGGDRRSRPVAMIVLLPPSVALRRFAQQNDDAGL